MKGDHWISVSGLWVWPQCAVLIPRKRTWFYVCLLGDYPLISPGAYTSAKKAKAAAEAHVKALVEGPP